MRVVAFLGFLLFPLITVARAQVSAEGQACLDCHSSSTPGIVEQWRESACRVSAARGGAESERGPTAQDHG